MPTALLSDDFVGAARLVAIATAINADIILAKAESLRGGEPIEATPAVKELIKSTPHAPKSALSVIPIVPISIRLASLQLRGGTSVSTAASLAEIDSVLALDLRTEKFTAEIGEH